VDIRVNVAHFLASAL